MLNEPKVGGLYKVIRNYPPSSGRDDALFGLFADRDIVFLVFEVGEPHPTYGVRTVKILKIENGKRTPKKERLFCTDKDFIKCFKQLI